MASIDRRAGGWRVRWRDPDGRARSRQCPDRTTAKRLLRDVERAVAEGYRWEPPDADVEPDLREVISAYLSDVKRSKRPITHRGYEAHLSLFQRWLEACHGATAPLRPELLSRRTLARYWDATEGAGQWGEPRSIATRRRYVQVAWLLWNWAYESEEFGDYFARPRKLEMPEAPSNPVIAPTWAQMDAVIEHAPSEWTRRLCVILRCTGLRFGQATRLEWRDVDLEGAVLTVRGELGKSKSERRGRRVPLAAPLIQDLAGWGVREGLLLPCGSTKPHWRRGELADAWKAAGVPRDVWFRRVAHAFRKGFVSELRRAGADVDAVEFLVGHSLGIRGIYTDPEALQLKQVIELVPAIGSKTGATELRRAR